MDQQPELELELPPQENISILRGLIRCIKTIEKENSEYLNSSSHKEHFAEQRAIKIGESVRHLLDSLNELSEGDIVNDWIREEYVKPAIRRGDFSCLSILPDTKGRGSLGEFLVNPLEFCHLEGDKIKELKERAMRDIHILSIINNPLFE